MKTFRFPLDDEVICEHLVTAQMKQIWACQLEMVEKFAEVCERHGLKWFASGGTLIGAVRHKGYIPWDDDIDIHMLADDYEKFCQIAPEELKPFFWQECRTQPGYGPRHGKIRNSQTTGCTKWEMENWDSTMNKGVFIDIFPLYYIPEGKCKRKIQKIGLRLFRHWIGIYESVRRQKLQPGGSKCKLLRRIEYALLHGLLRVSFQDLCVKYLKICQMEKRKTRRVGALSFDFDEPRFIWPTENYREMVDLPFMGGTIKAPVEWDACLKQQFGDYMVIRKGASMHSDILFDVNTPYAEKLKQNEVRN